jgi:hypothetical protein
MDYYQKYQKYKFKYLNLLSLTNYQSGGKNNDIDDIDDCDLILLDIKIYDVYSLLKYINEWYKNDEIEKQKLPMALTSNVIRTIISKTKPKCLNNIFKILQISIFSEDIQQRILKLEYEYRNKLLTFDNPEKIIYILNNLVDDDIKALFDNSDPYDLYPLNMSDLETYINKYK